MQILIGNSIGNSTSNRGEALPTVQTSSLQVSGVTANKIDSVSWTRGNGSKVLLVGKIGGPVDSSPVDNTTYVADLQMGLGSEIGIGNYVLYKGTASDLPGIISGLSPEDILHLRAFEFSGDPGAERYLTATATDNPISQSTTKSYLQRILDYSPIAFWPLNETSGTTADNAEGTAAMDGAHIAGGGGEIIGMRSNIFRSGEWAYRFPSAAALVNIYSADLNTAMNKNEGSIVCWIKVPTTAQWAESSTQRYLYIAGSTSNRFIIQHSSANTIGVIRTAGGTSKTVSIDMSSTPTTWQCIIVTYSVTNNEMKVYLNGVQQGTTQTSGSFSGSLATTTCCIGATDTSGTNDINDRLVSNVAIFNRVLTGAEVADLSNCPYETFLTNQYVQWDINALFGKQGSTLAVFMYDVDNDGEKELVCNIGEAAHFAAIKIDGTILWQTIGDTTQETPTRQPQVRNGVMYLMSNNKIYAVRLSDGAILWQKANTLGALMNCTDQGICVAGGTQVDMLSYSTGESLGGNWPFTLSFNVHIQNMSYGDLDEDGFDEVFVNGHTGIIQAIDHDGSDMFTITSLMGHVDLYTVSDIDGDGSPELVTVVDDDGSTGSDVSGEEGDEIALYDALGVQKDKYTTSNTGPTFRVGDVGATGKIVVAGETSQNLVLLNSTLDVVWNKSLSGRIQGGQVTLIDIDNDGDLEILVNTGEGPTFGFRVYDKNGDPKLFFTDDSPNVLTELVDQKGWNSPKKIVDFGEGYPFIVIDYVTPTLRDSPTGNENIFYHYWRLKSISGL